MATSEKQKPASHAYHVSNGAARPDYRRARAAEPSPDLESRARMAEAIAGDAAVPIARDAGHYICPKGTLAGIVAAEKA